MKNFSLKSVFKKKNVGTGVHPARDWYLLVTICLLLIIASAVWNAWLFLEIANGKSLGSLPPATVESTAHTVTDVQNIFKNRAAARVQYENEYQFVDPSK